MSKKLYQSQKYKSLLRRRQVARLRRLERAKSKPAERSTGSVKGTTLARRERTIDAPQVFSLIRDPESSVRFLAAIDLKARRNHLRLNFENVEVITPDAVAALTSSLRSKSRRYLSRIRGNHPRNEPARIMLEKSGFYDLVRRQHPTKQAATGRLEACKGQKVDGKIAQQLVRFGMECLTGETRRCLPVYETLIECMTNTKHHARADDMGEEPWWATVFADEARRRVCFTFLDAGVGILKSAKVNLYRDLLLEIGLKSDADVLKWLLHGQVGSRTGLPERGKGLPKIHRWSSEGRLRSLVIISNSVYANVEAGQYRLLPQPFDGTLLYWEVEP